MECISGMIFSVGENLPQFTENQMDIRMYLLYKFRFTLRMYLLYKFRFTYTDKKEETFKDDSTQT